MKKSWKSFMAVTAAAAAMTAAMAFSSLAAVAKVGETEYDDLQTAVNSGDKVVVDLLDDVTLTDGLVIGAGKDVTIRCEAEKPKTITMKTWGITTGKLKEKISNVKFINCHIDEVVVDHHGVGNGRDGETTNLFTNTNLTLDHVKWSIKSGREQLGKHGIFLDAETNLYIKNDSSVTIAGFDGVNPNSGSPSGLYQDASDRTPEMPPVKICISGKSKMMISDCGYNGITVDETIMTVEDYSKVTITNCGINDGHAGKGGLQCLEKLIVKNNSSVTSNENKGYYSGIFVNNLDVDATSNISACENNGHYGLIVGGKGEIADGAVLHIDNNAQNGLWTYCALNYYYGDVTFKSGSNVSICNNGAVGIVNSYKFKAEEGALLKIENNKDNGIRNNGEMTLYSGSICKNAAKENGGGILNAGAIVNKKQSIAKLTIGSGVRICNNHADAYGGGLYNGENGTAELADGVILYNNHADTGADDIYNTAGQKITFSTVGNGWNLDDCSHRIDGWYDDTEESKGTRWNADGLPEDRHMVLVTPNTYETEFQIKAAHGADIYEASDYPIDKKANGEDEIGTVKQGSRITFTLESKLPKLLARYVVTASNASPANTSKKVRKVRVHSASGARRASGANAYDYDSEISEQVLSADEKYVIPDSVAETIVFHDEMNRYLKFTDGSIRVTAGRDGKEIPSDYYAVTASDSNAFRVEVDLVKIFNAGIIDYEDLTAENPITVSYEAVVTDDAIQGDKLFNEAWVNDGEHDSVDGDVLDEKVPSTGGMGRGIFTGMGLLFMGTAAAASWKRKRSM